MAYCVWQIGSVPLLWIVSRWCSVNEKQVTWCSVAREVGSVSDRREKEGEGEVILIGIYR